MSGNYNGWGLYNDPSDPRMIVPKRHPAFGWTINLGHRSGRLTLILLATLLVAGLAGSILFG